MLCLIVLPHVPSMGRDLADLFAKFHRGRSNCFGGLSFMTMLSHLAQDGAPKPGRFPSKGGGETLEMVTAVEWRIVKALTHTLDCLPKVVSGGIDGCQTN